MASTQVNPTRMELTRLKKKLATATRGHKLLKDKRDELMRQFLDLVRENMALRQKVEAGIRSANVNFVIAKAGMSEQALNTALAAPKQAVYLEADKKNVMSVDIPVFHYKTRTADENDIYSYGFAFTSSDLDGPFPGGIAGRLPGKGYGGTVVRHVKILRLARRSGSAPGHGGRDGHGGIQPVQVFLDASGIPHDGFDAPETLPGGGSGQGAGIVDLRRDFRGGAPRILAAHDACRRDARPFDRCK